MAKNALAPRFLYFLACFWLFIAISPVFGGGSRDATLSRADELISNKEYDEATRLLSDYARRSPEKFDAAQKRIRKIYQIKEEFNRTADELILTIDTDPDNSEKIFALTSKLYSLENENSPLLQNFVSRTHEIAQFNVYRNRLRIIMEEGRRLLDEGACEEALRVYAGGMDLMRDQFFEAGYGERIENSVRQEAENINALIASFQTYSTQVGNISSELIRTVNSGGTAGVTEIINRLTPAMDNFIRQKQILYTTLNTYNRILGEIRQINPEMLDRNHISFASILILGRSGEDMQEGMLGAFDTYWNNSIGSAINAIVSYSQNTNTRNIAAFNSTQYAAVTNSNAGMERYIEVSTLFFNKHRELLASGNPQTISLYGNTILQMDIPSYLSLVSLNEANVSLTRASNIGAQLNVVITPLLNQQNEIININVTQALNDEQQARTALVNMQRELETIKTSATQSDTEISRYIDVPYIKNALNAIENLNVSLIQQQRNSVQRYYTIAEADLSRSLAERRSELRNGINLLDGQTRTLEDGEIVTYHYPSEASRELNAMLSVISSNIERGNALLAQNRNEPSGITANTEIPNIGQRIQASVNELNNIRNQGQTLAATAASRTALAETQRQEGERLFREAQSAYQRQNFETARDLLQRASDRYTASLAIQESAALRQHRDSQMISLGQAINTAQNEAIITEVRNLITTARNQYFEGNIQQAEDSLVRARNRWRITNADENEELVYWLGIVRGAMSARSGRVIPQTAPLYPEMSQLLSQAQINYEEGVRLINAGQRTLGLAKFDEARLQTREVKLMFPVNYEAGILEMKMEQFTDPAAFNAAFEQRLRTAINGTKQLSMESFADLQNLAEINSRYPNMRNILIQAEIDMRLRPPPPNPADIARSRELTASARSILERNATTQFEIALAQINEAISLNPENAEATRVKDGLLNISSMPGAVVLTSEDEDIYQRALREHTAGNNLVALALVERLLQVPRNRNITKVAELQRRIQLTLL